MRVCQPCALPQSHSCFGFGEHLPDLSRHLYANMSVNQTYPLRRLQPPPTCSSHVPALASSLSMYSCLNEQVPSNSGNLVFLNIPLGGESAFLVQAPRLGQVLLTGHTSVILARSVGQCTCPGQLNTAASPVGCQGQDQSLAAGETQELEACSQSHPGDGVGGVSSSHRGLSGVLSHGDDAKGDGQSRRRGWRGRGLGRLQSSLMVGKVACGSGGGLSQTSGP